MTPEIVVDTAMNLEAWPPLSGWRVCCYSCGWRSSILPARRAVTLAVGVHRHRHIVGAR